MATKKRRRNPARRRELARPDAEELRAARVRQAFRLAREQRELVVMQDDPQPAIAMPQCQGPGRRSAPEYDFIFRRPLELIDFSLQIPADFTIACVRVVGARLSLGADFRYRQRWSLRHLLIGDLASSIALAPGETLTLTIKKTQRTQFSENTVQSSESLNSFESSVVDKDVLNVARSTSNTQQWHVDGNANLSLGGVFSLGASSGLSRSTTDTSNSTAEHISEATQKTTKRLQTLQKVEVARQSENLLETAEKRTITNPYRDRSLTLNVFELAKEFFVTTGIDEIRPTIILEITDLQFDWDFVVTHGDFLDQTLLDRKAAAELQEVLANVQAPHGPSQLDKAKRIVSLAFQFLYDVASMFGLDVEPTMPGVVLPLGPPRRDFIADCFLASNNDSGLSDGINNALGRTFAALNYYYRVREFLKTQPGQLDELEIDLAVSLADAVRDEWTATSQDDVRDVMDGDNFSEIFRRLPGFLAIIDGLVKPLLKPLEEEREAKAAADRADYVIGRVIAHLGCNKAYYVRKFLQYLSEQTGMFAFGTALRTALANVQVAVGADALELFPPESGFLDGFQFVAPHRDRFTPADGAAFIDGIRTPGGPAEIVNFVESRLAELIVPTDGVHIEPAAGDCILRDVPDPVENVEADVSIRAGVAAANP
jgi:hypothetical protein